MAAPRKLEVGIVTGRRETERPLKTDKLWFLVVPSFVLFWILGVGFAWLLTMPLLIIWLSRSKRMPITNESFFLGALGLWLVMVIGVAVTAGTVTLGRIPGAGFAALIWLSIAILFHGLQRANAMQNFHFQRGLIFTGSVQGALTMAAVSVHPSPISSIRFPSASLMGGSSGITPWTVGNLAYTDYFGQGIVRSSGLMATAAWSGGFACLILILLVLNRRRLVSAGMRRLSWVIAVGMNSCSLYFSYSRVSMAIFIVITAVYFLYRALSRAIAGGALIAGSVVALIMFLGFSFYPWQDYLLAQDDLHPGSSGTRMASYDEGFTAAASSGPLAFLAGSGVKPFIEELGRGAGSESTYVSLLVRGGVISITLFAAFLFARIRRAASAKDSVSLALICALAIHAIVEDLDLGTLTILLVLIEPHRIVQADSTAEGLGKSLQKPSSFFPQRTFVDDHRILRT